MDSRRDGYASEAAAALRDYAFEELGLERLISLVNAPNERSVRVAERLGAVWERDVVTSFGNVARIYVHRTGQQKSSLPG